MDYQEAIEIIQYAIAFNSENSRLTKALDVAISAMQELQEYSKTGLSPKQVTETICELGATKRVLGHYKQLGTLEEVREAMQELKLYKDAKLCLIPEDVFSKQCEEVDAYREIGTLEEVKDAMERQQAKKPNNVEAEGYRYTKTYRCPTCGGNFSGTGIANYCYHCGQKLDWEEIKE